MIERLVPEKILNTISNYDCIVVGGIITVENKSGILFIKRSEHDFIPNTWEIPSGSIEKDESMLQAIKREIKEETCLDIIKIERFESAVHYTHKDRCYLQLNFGIYCSGTVILSNEHSEYKFSNISDFIDHLDTFMLKVLNLI